MGTGHRKSSAALLIVCERIFLLLGAAYSSADQVRTKDDELLKRVLDPRPETVIYLCQMGFPGTEVYHIMKTFFLLFMFKVGQ